MMTSNRGVSPNQLPAATADYSTTCHYTENTVHIGTSFTNGRDKIKPGKLTHVTKIMDVLGRRNNSGVVKGQSAVKILIYCN